MKKNKLLAALLAGFLALGLFVLPPAVKAGAAQEEDATLALSSSVLPEPEASSTPAEIPLPAPEVESQPAAPESLPEDASMPVSEVSQEPASDTVAEDELEELGEIQPFSADPPEFTPITIAKQFPDPAMADAVAYALRSWDPSVEYEIDDDDILYTKELYLYGNISDLTGISIFKNLTTLEINSQIMEEVSPEIGQLTQLEELHFYSIPAKSLPDVFQNMTNLRKLVVYLTGIEELPESIGSLVNLEELTLRESKIASLPQSIANLQNLKELVFIGNNLSEFPMEITKLTNLNKLLFAITKVPSLPEEIGNLTNLLELDLSSNRNIVSLPSSIGNLSQLRQLSLSSLGLVTLPESIGQLHQLTHIDLGYNKLTALPESFGDLKSLTHLGVQNNNLTALPDSIKNLTNLYSVSAGENQLTTLPEGLFASESLDMLFMPDNKISVVPDFLLDKSFNLLVLSGNQITYLPEGLQRLGQYKVNYYGQIYNQQLEDTRLGQDTIIPLLPIMIQSLGYDASVGDSLWKLQLYAENPGSDTGWTAVETPEPLAFDYDKKQIVLPASLLAKTGNYKLEAVLTSDTKDSYWADSLYTFNFTVATYVNLTFETHGGNAVSAQALKAGSLATQPSNPVKKAHIFKGWFTDSQYKTPWDFAAMVVEHDTTLYAKWEKPVVESSSAPSASSSAPSSVPPASSSKPATPSSEPPAPPVAPPAPSSVASSSSTASVPSSSSRPVSSSSNSTGSSSAGRSENAFSGNSGRTPGEPNAVANDPQTATSTGGGGTAQNGQNVLPVVSQEETNQETLQELKDEGVPVITLGDVEIPLYGSTQKATWSLINLILALLSLAAIAPSIAGALGAKARTGMPWTGKTKQITVISVAVAAAGLVLLFTLNSFSGLMVLANAFTPLFLVVLAGQVALIIWGRTERLRQVF